MTSPPQAEQVNAVSKHIRRLSTWKHWRSEYVAVRKQLKPDALRVSYSLRGNLHGIPEALSIPAMGRSL